MWFYTELIAFDMSSENEISVTLITELQITCKIKIFNLIQLWRFSFSLYPLLLETAELSPNPLIDRHFLQVVPCIIYRCKLKRLEAVISQRLSNGERLGKQCIFPSLVDAINIMLKKTPPHPRSFKDFQTFLTTVSVKLCSSVFK